MQQKQCFLQEPSLSSLHLTPLSLSDSHAYVPACVQIIVYCPRQLRLQALLGGTICFIYCLSSCPSEGHSLGAPRYLLNKLYKLYMFDIWNRCHFTAVVHNWCHTVWEHRAWQLFRGSSLSVLRSPSRGKCFLPPPPPVTAMWPFGSWNRDHSILFPFLLCSTSCIHRNVMPYQSQVISLAQSLTHF